MQCVRANVKNDDTNCPDWLAPMDAADQIDTGLERFSVDELLAGAIAIVATIAACFQWSGA